MARINVVSDAGGGIIKDMIPEDLPPEVWTDGYNIRFSGKAAKLVSGMASMVTVDSPPNWVMPLQTPTQYFWLVGTSTQIWALVGGVLTDLSRATPAYKPVYTRWQGGVFNGTPFFNNGQDAPQIWGPLTLATKLVDLPNWPAGWLTTNINTYKSFMVILQPTKSGIVYPRDVAWSSAAGPGAVPLTWDQSDPTHEAGEVPLAETNGLCVDQLVLGDSNIIYKDDSVYSMTYIGGQSIFKFRKLFEPGILTQGCVALFPSTQGEKHCYLAADNAYIHDGVNNIPLLTDYWQEALFNNVEQTALSSCFVVTNRHFNEVWICFPEVNKQTCTAALCYNYIKSTFSIRQLTGALWGASGIVPIGGGIAADSWATDTQTWAQDLSNWGEKNYKPAETHIVLANSSTNKILAVGFGYNIDGTILHAWLERIGLTITGQDRKGNPIYDTEVWKQVNEVWPRLKGTRGTSITINVGAQETADSTIEWDSNGPYPFIIGQDRKINCFAAGRILAIRFEATIDQGWEVHGYDFDLVQLGKY